MTNNYRDVKNWEDQESAVLNIPDEETDDDDEDWFFLPGCRL